MIAKKRIIILGAGLSGLSAAWHLQRKGIDCQVFEKEPEAGGLCRSKNVSGFTFDCDGHLLHFKYKPTFKLVKSLLGGNLIRHKRNAWVYSHRRYIRYPFQANLYALPSAVIQECLRGYIARGEQAKKKKELSFSGWVNQTFGKGIAQNFMLPYNRKFWTLPLEKLTCEWLDGFIPVPSRAQIIQGATGESQSQLGYNASFWYPQKGGISALPLAFAARVKNIHTNYKITGINLDRKEIMLSGGNKEKFDYLISTIPLPEMPDLINNLPREIAGAFKKLRWNSIFNLNLGVERSNCPGKHWVYFPQKCFSFFRIGFFNSFSPYSSPRGRGSVYTEVAYSENKPLDKNNIVGRIENDLRGLNILGEKDKIYARDVNDIKYGYPIYDLNYHRCREKVIKYLSRNNILPCGRYGSWRYFSMEDSILDGKRVAGILC